MRQELCQQVGINIKEPGDVMQEIDAKPPLFITINGESVGRAEGHDAHGTLIDDRAYDLRMDPEEYFDQSDLIYVDSGGEQLLFDARPELEVFIRKLPD